MAESGPTSPADRQQANALLRRLLPADSAAQDASNGPPESAGSRPPPTATPAPPVLTRRKRGQATTAACGACRKRKSKCDGRRPTCSICRDRGTVCEFDTHAAETHTQALKRKYNELKSQKSAFEQVYEVLRSRSDEEAEEVYRRIRRGADASSILRHVNYGDLLVQLAVVPEARYRYEFPYLPDMPPFLRRPDNAYLDSEVYECALRGPPAPATQHEPEGVSAVGGAVARDPYLKPYLATTVVHPWLDSVKPSKWTNVSTDDVLMRKILHDYLLFDYDSFTFFQKDFFLEDMATENHRFCSELLVNAVLCIGSFCHRGLQGRAEFWNPKNIGYQFLAEAKRLFETESEFEAPLRVPGDPDWERKQREWEQRRLMTIQAALLINLAYNLNGSDKIGWRYTSRALEMANDVQLLGPALEHYGPEMQRARAYTAWGLFCWQILVCYHYLQPPLIREPPQIPLPDPLQDPQWYGELWVKYPMSQSLWPTFHGLLFKAKAEFWSIVNEIALLSFSRRRSPARLPVDQILRFYNRLSTWLHNLPEPLTPKQAVLPQHLKLHMHYNNVVFDLVTPILGHGAIAVGQSRQTPRDIYMEAVTNFETVIRLYYLRHSFEAADSFLLHFLGLLNHMTMTAIETSKGSSFLESRRSTLLLLSKGIHDQSRSFFVASAILRLQLSAMRPEDVGLLRQFVKLEEDQLMLGSLEQALHTNWPVYEIGLEAKAVMREQGRMLANSLASLTLQPSNPPTPSHSPT